MKRMGFPTPTVQVFLTFVPTGTHGFPHAAHHTHEPCYETAHVQGQPRETLQQQQCPTRAGAKRERKSYGCLGLKR